MGKYKLFLNNKDEYIDILTDDSLLFDRFAESRKRVMDMAAALPRKRREIEKESKKCSMEKTIALCRLNVDFSKEAIEIMDGVFGKGTIEKYFRKIYEEAPDFTPGPDCFMDFFKRITPVMEQLFGRKI